MSEPALPKGMQVHKVRVYFEPKTGKVVNLHQMVSGPGEDVDAEQVDRVMNALEASLRERYAELDYLTVGEDELRDISDRGITVDVERRVLRVGRRG